MADRKDRVKTILGVTRLKKLVFEAERLHLVGERNQLMRSLGDGGSVDQAGLISEPDFPLIAAKLVLDPAQCLEHVGVSVPEWNAINKLCLHNPSLEAKIPFYLAKYRADPGRATP